MLTHRTETLLSTLKVVTGQLLENPVVAGDVANQMRGWNALAAAVLEGGIETNALTFIHIIHKGLNRLVAENRGAPLAELLSAALQRIAETTDTGPPAAAAEPKLPDGRVVSEERSIPNVSTTPDEPRPDLDEVDADPSPAEAAVVSRLAPTVSEALARHLQHLSRVRTSLDSLMDLLAQKPGYVQCQFDGAEVMLSEANVRSWRALVTGLLTLGRAWQDQGTAAAGDAYTAVLSTYVSLMARWQRSKKAMPGVPTASVNGVA